MLPHPISTTYLDKQVARVSAVLPGAGAYDGSPLELYCAGFSTVTIFGKYTRAAGGGKTQIKIEVSNDADGTDWYQVGAYTQPAVVSATDTTSLVQRNSVSYGSTAAGAQPFAFPGINIFGAERIRLPARESGGVAAGTLVLEVIFER
jgi:hypothetical protein